MGNNKEQLQASSTSKILNILLQQNQYVFNVLFFLIGLSIGIILCLHLKSFSIVFLPPLYYQTPPSSGAILSLSSGNNHSNNVSLEEQKFLLMHNMSDQDLFLKVSSSSLVVPRNHHAMRPKLAFMFLTGGPLPLIPLWEKFFQGHEGFYSIYVHPHPSFQDSLPESSIFHGRRIPSQPVYWGTSSMVDAERRLLANALLDVSNQRFVLVSDSCIPLFNFTTIYAYLMDSTISFIGSFDDPRKSGRGRYNPQMSPEINITHWRKGSQWFEVTRELALNIVNDTKYYPIFVRHCLPPCYVDEHYIPTLVNMLYGEMNMNRSITWVDWSRPGPHPGRFVWPDVTDEFLNRIRYGEQCIYYGGNTSNNDNVTSNITSLCFLFARKFTAQTLEPLLRVAPLVLGFDP